MILHSCFNDVYSPSLECYNCLPNSVAFRTSSARACGGTSAARACMRQQLGHNYVVYYGKLKLSTLLETRMDAFKKRTKAVWD